MARYSNQTKSLEKRLAAIPARVKQAVRPALEKGAEEIAAAARALAPVDEGDLRDSITTDNGQHELEVVVTAGTENDGPARHARWVEFGRADTEEAKGTDPQPFLYPAVRLLQKRVKRRIATAVTRAVKKEFQP